MARATKAEIDARRKMVAKMLEEGFRGYQIAKQAGISVETVEKHREYRLHGFTGCDIETAKKRVKLWRLAHFGVAL